MRVVLDSNVYISAAAFDGVPLLVLQAAERQEFTLYASAAIQNEVHRVLRDKMEWTAARVAEAFDPIWELAQFVESGRTIRAWRDEADNHILECAVASSADVVVTGDKDLLVLTEVEGILIVTARQFLDQYAV